jgi:rod shape-determining protein MreC
MSAPRALRGVLDTLLAILERRRGTAILVLAAIFLGLGTTTTIIRRPPLVAPVVDGVTGRFLSLFSQPLKLARFFEGPGGGRSRIMELELELASLRRAERENRRLRAMMGYAPPPGFQTVPGRIIGLDLDPLRGVAWIGLGEGQGLRGGEAVMTVDGLVGVVSEVRDGRSRVRLLRNEVTPISVRDTRSRSLGVVDWDPGAGRLRLNQVPFPADIAVGDTLVSSGLGGVFPPDLPVGVVTEVHDPPERLLKEVRVRSFGRFDRLEEVFVLIPWEGPVVVAEDTSPVGAAYADSTAGGPAPEAASPGTDAAEPVTNTAPDSVPAAADSAGADDGGSP